MFARERSSTQLVPARFTISPTISAGLGCLFQVSLTLFRRLATRFDREIAKFLGKSLLLPTKELAMFRPATQTSGALRIGDQLVTDISNYTQDLPTFFYWVCSNSSETPVGLQRCRVACDWYPGVCVQLLVCSGGSRLGVFDSGGGLRSELH